MNVAQNRLAPGVALRALSERVLQLLRSYPNPDYPDPFGELALELFHLQYRAIPVYARFCQARNRTPETVRHWSEIPAVPTSAFKHLPLTSLAEEERTRVFFSSGTTGQERSRHFHSAASLELYEASLFPWFRQHLLPELGAGGAARARASTRDGASGGAPRHLLALVPPSDQAPHSSLVHMFETVGRSLPGWGVEFFGVADASGSWTLKLDALVERLDTLSAARLPVLLLGTAFSFVHLLDHLRAVERRFRLPTGSRVLETGGYKGRSRALPEAELHDLLGQWLGISRSHIVVEYGMSELSSQAYDRVAGQGSFPGEPGRSLERSFHFPPWARIRIISPETGQEVAEGEIGLVTVHDLANVWSIAAVQTEDLAKRRDAGFELIGRAEQVEARGCSLMTP